MNPLFSPMLMAQLTATTTNAGVNWLSQFTNNLTNLTTQNGGALTQVGTTLLSFIAFLMLVSMVIQWNTAGMAISFHQRPVNVGDLMNFLIKLIICCLLETYWVNPIPGASFGLNKLFAYFAQVLVAAFDQNSLDSLLTNLHTLGANTPSPAAFAVPEWICYFLVQGLMGLASAVLFLINCSAFIFYGVAALFGPIFIPLLMTNNLKGKFYRFMDVLLAFAMIRAVAAAFIFVWAGFLNGFIQQTFNSDYSIAMWMANLVPVCMVFVAFILNMAFIPKITEILFGGGAGVAGRIGEVAEYLAAKAAAS